MATIKSYTTIEQSRKLAEFLPIESADMRYTPIGDIHPWVWEGNPKLLETDSTPCWSLAALLNYLKSKNKFPEIKELSDGRFALTTYIWDGEDCIQNSIGVTIVDACYELIIKLHELNLL